MAIASILLGVAALLMMLGAIFTTFIPIVGTVLSFGTLLLALAGVVTGGVGISRARRDGESTGPGVAGVVLSVVGLVLGLLVAVTCGVCNLMCTAGSAGMIGRDAGARWWMDAGAGTRGPALGPGPSPGAADGGTGAGSLAPPPPGDWADGPDGGAEGSAETRAEERAAGATADPPSDEASEAPEEADRGGRGEATDPRRSRGAPAGEPSRDEAESTP